MTEADLDALLHSAMTGPERAPDEAFVARLITALQAEEQLAALRSASTRRAWAEAAGSTAIAIAIALLWRMVPAGGDIDLSRLASVNAAVLVLAVWLIVGLQTSSGGRPTS